MIFKPVNKLMSSFYENSQFFMTIIVNKHVKLVCKKLKNLYR